LRPKVSIQRLGMSCCGIEQLDERGLPAPISATTSFVALYATQTADLVFSRAVRQFFVSSVMSRCRKASWACYTSAHDVEPIYRLNPSTALKILRELTVL
jgi:hypothetical protein